MDPYVGEIKMAGYNFNPRGWALCYGQLLPISQNTALFSILGTTYGGNGTSTFGLPDLRSRAIMGWDQTGGNELGEQAGTESVTLLLTEYPAHTHAFNVYNTFGLAGQPTALHYLSATRANVPPSPPPPPPPTAGPNLYGSPTSLTPLIPAVLAGYSGGSQPHENRQPYLCMNYCIALQGVFPARN